MKKEKTTKKKGSVMTTREKMLARKKDLEKRSGGGGIIYPKEGTTRVRIKSRGADEELGIEIIQFYLGPKEGGIISPATFDEPCPFMEKFQELKNSDDPDDKALASKLVPKRKYLIGVLGYKDTKGKEIDPDRVDKPMMVPRSVYQDIIDLYLDEEDWGDMTDPVEGYDIKITVLVPVRTIPAIRYHLARKPSWTRSIGERWTWRKQSGQISFPTMSSRRSWLHSSMRGMMMRMKDHVRSPLPKAS